MNRIKVLVLTLVGALCVVSCNDKIGTEISDTLNYITVTSGVGPQSKAGYEGISVLPEQFVIDINQGGDKPYYHKTMTKGQGNKYVFLNNEQLLWADNSHSNVSIKAMTLPVGATDNSGVMEIRVKDDQRNEADLIASDLLGATTDDGSIQIKNHNINIDFKHLMSKLQIVYNTSNSTVTSIDVNGLSTSGMYSYESMSYGNAGGLGNIQMYHNSADKTAEGIFFPYTPTSNPQIVITIAGETEPLTCPISLNKVTRFEGGKCYIMKIAITGSTIEGAEISVKDWTIDNNTIKVTGENVLWTGTSIPGGWPEMGITSYPELVDEAMNCTIVNNALPSSTVVRQIDADWIRNNTKKGNNTKNANGEITKYGWDDEGSVLHIQAGGLAHTHADAEALRTTLETVWGSITNNWGGTDATKRQQRTTWVNTQIDKIKAYSYETLIIPHIDGTSGKTQCTTVIIDHGYNDRGAMVAEALGLAQRPESVNAGPEYVEGYNYLMKLINRVINYDQYKEHVNDPDFSGLAAVQHYIVDMEKIITAIRNKNSNVRIIIGNYFTLRNTTISSEYQAAGLPNYQYYTELICYFNEAVATLFNLDIVNVYEHLWLDESKFSSFCTDGVHPWTNQLATDAIAQIYINELDGVIGSRDRGASANTSSSSAKIALGLDSWDDELDVL